MPNIFSLESRKTLLDYHHAKEELKIKKEMIEEIDVIFNNAVSEYINTQIEIKDQWDVFLKKHDDNITEVLNLERSKPIEEIESIYIEENIDDLNFKQFYREIVKKTHPDKIQDLSIEERDLRVKLYIEATTAYEKKSLPDLLYCAYLLHIPFELSIEDLKELKESLIRCKRESEFLEKTYTWLWYHTSTDLKADLIIKFIDRQLKL